MSEKIASVLFDSKCIQLSISKPFTYASGLEGPIYCDNRKLLSNVAGREVVIEAFLSLIEREGMSFDHFGGLATAGIPHAAFLGDRLKKSMIYIRSKAKSHGKENQIEGVYKRGDKVLLVEDLVNQGSSLEKAIIASHDAGLEVVGCICIVDYQMAKAKEVLKKYKVDLFSLINFETLTDEASKKNIIKESERPILLKWQESPSQWIV